MELKEAVQLISSILFCLGILVGGMGYLISVYRKGNKQENTEVVSTANQLTDFWKDQVQGFKDMLAEQNGRIQILSNELNMVKGQLIEKEKQIKNYLDILQNRNPELEKFMEHMMQSVKDQSESHGEIVKVLKDLHVMAKAEHERDFQISATVTKQ